MKTWNIEIYLLDEAGNQKPATCFTKAVYNLHESFANPIQSTSCSHFPALTLEQGQWLILPCKQPSLKHPSAARMRDGVSLIC